MRDKLQKALDISKKTGDRIIVFDSVKNNDPYVIMGLDEYEKIVVGRSEVRDLTEEELLDKINRDIAVWKSDNEDRELDKKAVYKIKNTQEKLNDFDCLEDFEEEDTYYYDEPEVSPLDLIKDDEEEDDDFLENSIFFKDTQNKSSMDREQTDTKNIWKIPRDIKESAEEIM